MLPYNKTRFADDLAWAMTSPSLLTTPPAHCSGSIVPTSLGEDIINGASIELAANITHKTLGHYFEKLISYAIQHNKNYTLLAQNLGVFADKKQLGEFDLIFKDQTSQIVHHWETSVKFYLYSHQFDQWFGPNPRDRLDLKLAKIFNHQLKLQHHNNAQVLLKQKFGLSNLLSAAFLKGYLFYPWFENHLTNLPSWINPRHLRGWWCYLNQLDARVREAQNEPQDKRWAILPRLSWLSPAMFTADYPLITSNELAATLTTHLNQFNRAPLVVELHYINNTWKETSRGFVVFDHWPNVC